MEDQEEERTDTSRRQPEVQQPLPAAAPEPVNLELYKSEASRLETFSGWPHRVIRPADLANAGFIYTGERDMVRCVFCGQYVGNWEDDDFPMVEHRTLFPNCPFMQGFNVGNVPLPSYHQQQSTPSRVDHQASTSSGFSGAAMEIPEPTNIDETGIRPHHRQAFSGPEKGILDSFCHHISTSFEAAKTTSFPLLRHTSYVSFFGNPRVDRFNYVTSILKRLK